MRRWVLFLSLLVMAGVLSLQYYYGLPGRISNDFVASAVYNFVVPAVWVVLAIVLAARMFSHKNRDGVMTVASFILGFLLVAGLFTGVAHSGGKVAADKDQALTDAQKAVQNAINNWDTTKNGNVPMANGTIDYKKMGFGGCPGENTGVKACDYVFTLGADKTVSFTNRAQFVIKDPVLGSKLGIMPDVGVFSIFDLIGWLSFAVAMSANLFLLLESFVGVEMPVDLIYDEGVEAQ